MQALIGKKIGMTQVFDAQGVHIPVTALQVGPCVVIQLKTVAKEGYAAAPLRSFIDPDAADFLAPGDMPEAIRAFCRKTGQPVPDGRGAIIRCALESMAMKFRHVLGMCQQLTGSRLETVHIVGGGVQNRLLCQFAADACGRRVLAGPRAMCWPGSISAR